MTYQRADQPQVPAASGNAYLQAMVSSASPARLRLMLIERGFHLAEQLVERWGPDDSVGANEISMQLLEILSELLSGVTSGRDDEESEVCRQVADLYVFLSQHLLAAEPIGDAEAAREISSVLGIEADTWREVCSQETDTSVIKSGGAGLNFTA